MLIKQKPYGFEKKYLAMKHERNMWATFFIFISLSSIGLMFMQGDHIANQATAIVQLQEQLDEQTGL
jgi:hypothetical protein